MVNKVILMGNLGKNPEVRFSQVGAAICSFNMATTETFKNVSGEKEERTEWHKIVCFGRLGEICGEYLQKGSKIYLEGRIQTRSWEDKDGNKKYTTEIVGHEMKMLSPKNGNGNHDQQHQAAPQNHQEDVLSPEPVFDNNDVPF